MIIYVHCKFIFAYPYQAMKVYEGSSNVYKYNGTFEYRLTVTTVTFAKAKKD